MLTEEKPNQTEEAQNNQSSPPSISLPKGGGAIRGIGEKFAANPVTGTGSLSVPIATSPGRSGFGPQLSLTYDSGAGNGPFGFGWNLSLPTITRKTDKGLPKYQDGDESDTFILSGAEDLVPVLKQQGNGWALEELPDRTIGPETYRIQRYRPRIEGLFARIERWTDTRTNETHWRSITRDNVVTVYGRTTASRIEDPNPPEGSPRVFSWLICESYDDNGNAIYYEYEPEDSAEIDLSQTNERNRTDKIRSANRYLKRIKYGNKTPVEHDSDLPREVREDLSKRTDWLFEVLFDYDEGHYEALPADPDGRQFVNACINPTQDWQRRQDPFSSFRSGFEVRTYRLCHRVLMFHHFPDELGVDNYLVRSTGFTYKEGPIASLITSVTQSGFKRQDDGTFLKKSLPPLEFEYSEAVFQDKVEDVDVESIENLPQGLDGTRYQWADIDGEGLSGLLTEQGDSWFYKRNVSALPVMDEDCNPHTVARFAPIEHLATIPSFANLSEGRRQLLDLAGDGQLDVAEFDSPTPGFYERTKDEAWHPFKPFVSLPNISWQDPNLKFVDLTGDGHADIFITEEEAFTWYPSLAETGFACGEKVCQALDEEKGPKLVLADGTQAIYLADISGDGLTDLVRIRNGEVCYWPNLGYGRFGAKVTMDNSPYFDAPDHFDQRRIRLADIDGSGVTDIIYLKDNGVYIYLNESGNRWADAEKLKSFPKIDHLSSVMAVDLLGNGTACLVWSSPLPGDTSIPMRYVNLMGGQKPHLLVSVTNNLGTETDVQYAPSTKFYLADKLAGKPWITRLPFPVHCVEKVTVKDKWRETTFSTQYSYHHGYFDGFEREFRGFGRVEQIDIETYGEFARGNTASPYITDDKTLYQPPVKTITWYHTGAFIDNERIISQYRDEYFPNGLEGAGFSVDPNDAFSERDLPEPDLTDQELSTEGWREALRACKGMTLRQEIYELNVDALENGEHIPVKLFSTADHNCQIRQVQPKGDNAHAVFLVTESEALTYHYELDLRIKTLRPDPCIAHSLTLRTNKYGQAQQVVAVGYPRAGQFQDDSGLLTSEDKALIREVQNELHISYEETRYTHDVEHADRYRLRLPCEVFSFELTGVRPEEHGNRDRYFTLDELRRFDLSEVYPAETENPLLVGSLSYHEIPDRTHPQKRIVERVRTLYFSDNLNTSLSLGELNHLGLLYEAYTLALTDDLLDAILKEKLETVREDGEDYAAAVQRILSEGGYHLWDGMWWNRSGIAGFADDAEDHFFLPERYEDPFDQVTELEYDDQDIYIRQSKDPVGNVTSVEEFNYRVLAPAVLKDPNDNFSAVAFDALGMPVASAVMGESGLESGDNLEDIDTDLEIVEISTFFIRKDYDEDQAADWLGNATARFVYCFGEKLEGKETTYENHPACACGIVREKHVNEDANSPIRTALEYSDGLGQVLVTKSQAEPKNEGEAMRWIASGKTILNNKGKPVKQYEPYFSPTDHCYEEPQQVGVTPVIYYDAVGRVIRTELPDGAYSRVEFSPWFMAAFDPNDTVLEPNNAWYERNSAADASPESRRTATLAADHADTPAGTHTDSLGREVVAVAHNKFRKPDDTLVEKKYVTFTKLDAEGKPLWIRDARGNRVMQYITPSIPDGQSDDPSDGYVPCYDIAGNLLYQHGMDAGDRWMLNDVTGQPLFSWDSRANILHSTYDALRRPQKLELRNDDHPDWIMVGYTQYGDDGFFKNKDFKSRNLRGQAFRIYDQSGLMTTERFDFKGNLLTVHRRLAEAFTGDINWQSDQNLPLNPDPDNRPIAEAFTQTTEYDALNRVVRQYPWYKGVGSRVNVFEPYYNERGLLKREDLWLDATKTVTGYENGSKTEVIKGLTHDAKGQRKSITYGNGATTTYDYDQNTYRLIHLETHRRTDNKTLQDLSYTYDPSGNITEIIDKAQPTVFFNNFQVDAKNQYTYDALYRLIQAKGREHAGQAVHGDHDNWHDCFYHKKHHANDLMAWQNYTECYEYDAVGNILSVKHRTNGSDPNNWTRNYQYARFNNRLLATGMGDDTIDHYPQTPTLEYGYSYNEHGSMTAMPHLSGMQWDITENLHHVARSAGTQGEGDDPCPDASIEAWYRYDADKQRTRKRVVRGGEVEERFYLGGVEIFRRSNGAGTLILERETLHIMDDTQRIAMVETKNIDTSNDPSPTQLIRYQFGNHLGSASLELDNNGQVISYEEYYPYGNTSYHALDKNIKASAKRYRYTGKERDEETGLYYHGARYYTPWIVRWTAADPAGLVDGLNLYGYVRGSPLMMSDPSGGQSLTPEDVAQLGGISLSEARKLGRPVVQPRGTFEEHVEQLDASGTASAGIAALGSGRVQTTLGDNTIVKSFGEHSSLTIPKGQEPSAFEVVPALLTSGITAGPSMVEGVLMGSYNLTTGILEAVEADTDEAQDKAIGRAIAGGVDVALGIFGGRSLGKNPKLSKPPPKPPPKPAQQLPNTVPQAPVLESATPVGAASPPPSVNPSQLGPFTAPQRNWVKEVVGLNRGKSPPKTMPAKTMPDPFDKTMPDPFGKTEVPHIPGKKNPVQFIKFTQDQIRQIELWHKKIKGKK